MGEQSVRARISKRVVDGLAPHPSGAARVCAWDAEIKGFGVKVYPTGRKVYVVKYDRRGKDQTFTIGEHGSPWTAEAARTRAREVLNAVAGGGDPSADKQRERTALTIGEMIEKWLEEGPMARPTKREWSWVTDRSRLRRHVAPLLGRMAAYEVTRRDVEKMQARIAAGATAGDVKTGPRGRAIAKGGPLVASNTVVCLSAMFGWAVEQGLLKANPCLGVKKVKPAKRQRMLSRDETARLLDTLDEMVAVRTLRDSHAEVLRLLLLTGARKTEILGLMWREVDLERRCILLPEARSKTGARDPIRLAVPAIEILQRQNRGSDYVFPRADGMGYVVGLQKVWERVRKHAGLEDVRIHDLRHNAASIAVNQGASLYLTGKMLGHRNAMTTQRYAHVADDPVQQVAENVARAIVETRSSADKL